MEPSTQASSPGSPATSRSSTPASSSRSLNVKPLPLLPSQQPPHVFEPYRDDPSDTQEQLNSSPIISPALQYQHQHRTPSGLARRHEQTFFAPYTDDEFADDDDDVPLAHLYPYPTEAPPSYHVAVRESFRATLIAHIPRRSISSATDVDEEAARDGSQTDEARFSMERFVATIVVSMLLVVIAALLALIALAPFRDAPVS